MAQLQKGETFIDGETVNAARLNALVDAAIALGGLIFDRATVVPDIDEDYVLIFDASAAAPTQLRRCLITALPSGVTSVSATASPTSVFGISVATPGTTPAIALTLDSQSQRMVLASPVNSAGVPSFRAILPADTAGIVTVLGNNPAAVDWSESNFFFKALSGANANFVFSNPTAGQVIRVHVSQDASHTVHFVGTGNSPVLWPDGTPPVMTTGAGRHDFFTFRYSTGRYFGTFEQDFRAP